MIGGADIAIVTRLQVVKHRQLAFILTPKDTFCLVRESVYRTSVV